MFFFFFLCLHCHITYHTTPHRCTDTRRCTVHLASDKCADDPVCIWNTASSTCADRTGCIAKGMATFSLGGNTQFDCFLRDLFFFFLRSYVLNGGFLFTTKKLFFFLAPYLNTPPHTVTESTCSESPACMWSTDIGSCLERSCSGFATPAACDEDAVCYWNTALDICSTHSGCIQHTWDTNVAAACGSDPACMWDDVTCVDKTGCALHVSTAQCYNDTSCEWVSGDEICADVGCPAVSGSANCTANSSCDWFIFTSPAPRCDFNCDAFGQTDCAARSICRWNVDTNLCEQSNGCDLQTSSPKCNSLALCEWSNTTKCGAMHPCDETDQTSCDLRDKCSWKDGACTETNRCHFYPSLDACETNLNGDECHWGDNGCEETLLCPAFLSEAECQEQNDICEWSETCLPRCDKDLCVHGTCDAGSCVCEDGFSGANCDVCSLTDADGACEVCSEEMCHHHGTCEAGRCLCMAGWSGPFCAQRACLNTDPTFVTTYPLRPLKDEQFTYIIHGCFNASLTQRVTVIPAEESCGEVEVPAECSMFPPLPSLPPSPPPPQVL